MTTESQHTIRRKAQEPLDEGGFGEVEFPILSDLTHQISSTYGCLINEGIYQGSCLSACFIINQEGVLRHSEVNDILIPLNVQESLRFVQAFQHTDVNGQVCPASWIPGKKAMVAD